MATASKGVLAVTSGAEHLPTQGVRGRIPLDELARRKGVRPVESVDEMAQDGVFESDEDVDAFLAHVHASRRADLG